MWKSSCSKEAFERTDLASLKAVLAENEDG